jgi:hypothetical protein
MKELFGGADAEAGGLFAMKWAQAHEVGTALFQLDITAHHFDHVDAGK